jgi:hypothetical protein
MENPDVPFIAVIGGLWQLDEPTAASAKAAAQAIGAELAKAGFGLVVYFSNPESLEPYVVSGYSAAVVTGRDRMIRVRYAQSQRGKVKFNEEATRSELFDPQLFPGEDWEAPFYQSLADEEGVDAVLLLGGATSTLIAGQIAIARRLPILAIDGFGGSAGNDMDPACPNILRRKIFLGHPLSSSAHCATYEQMYCPSRQTQGSFPSRTDVHRNYRTASTNDSCCCCVRFSSSCLILWDGISACRR